MSYMAIPTMAQAMSNKVGTTAHAKQPGTDAAAKNLFETLLSAAGSSGTGEGSGVLGAEDADARGMWGTLLSKYMATGLTREETDRSAGDALLSSTAGLGPEALGAMLRARLGEGAALSDIGPGTGSINRLANGAIAGSGNRPADAAGAGEAALGFLSAAFESGAAGCDAIGYDPGGGTSYGIYQIASRPGTMDRFIDFLDREAPAWGERLRAAGEANTGGRGGEMPRVWKAIASEDPARFTGLQHAFIEATHYRPAEQKIFENEGLAVAERSEALREVLWSTAVQHGPDGAARIFQIALDRLRAGGGDSSDAAIIDQVYALRADTAARHDPELASALRNRFRAEKRQSLEILASGGNGEAGFLG